MAKVRCYQTNVAMETVCQVITVLLGALVTCNKFVVDAMSIVPWGRLIPLSPHLDFTLTIAQYRLNLEIQLFMM